MKNAIFAVLVVLLALLAVTCDLFEAAEPAPPSGAAPEGWVTLTIGAAEDRSRAMNAVNANAEINYYEVVFVNETLIVRSTNTASTHGSGFTTTSPWTVNIPIGDYNGIDAHAVLFAGNRVGTDNTLLAVGIIDSDTYITLGSGTVTFRLEAIETGVDITAPADRTKTFFEVNYKTAIATPTEVVTTATGNHLAFNIPHKSEGIKAAYRFVVPNSEYIILTATPTAVSTQVDSNSKTLAGVTASPGTPGNFPTGATFTLTMDTTGWEWDNTVATNNLTSVSISVPVKAITAATDLASGTGQPWFIRGGTSSTDNLALDDGAGGTGGAVLLKLLGSTLSEIETATGSP